jgi:pimeloyl-ACP methyl ester carboxylesterase
MPRLPGLVTTDHVFTVPLNHARPDGPSIEVMAREVVAASKTDSELPWLVYLQGGPGGPSPRPTGASGWIERATRDYRVLLLDQRGTGRSTPVTTRTAKSMPPSELASYLRHFRADSIVRDLELIRAQLNSGKRWSTLGTSYGGFITLTYLSLAPEGLTSCYITGGLPGLDTTAEEVYRRTYPRVKAKVTAFYERSTCATTTYGFLMGIALLCSDSRLSGWGWAWVRTSIHCIGCSTRRGTATGCRGNSCTRR